MSFKKFLRNMLEKLIDKLLPDLIEEIDDAKDYTGQSPAPAAEPQEDTQGEGAAPVEEPVPLCGSDETPFGELDFDVGGFHGARAQIVDDAVIGNLKVSSSGMSYKWIKGGCEKLGAADKGDADHTVACLFCLVQGKWHGGKFDWISTSRTTRDFKNVHGSYNGWNGAWLAAATKFAFVIVESNGKRRTNVIECGGLK